MDNMEPKKLALLRILQIFEKFSDCDHPLSQEEIASRLKNDYGIEIERKAIGRNIALLKDAGFGIESGRGGSYLCDRTFEDSELRMLIDGVLCGRYITAKHSAALIEKLSRLSSDYFRSHLTNVYTVNDWCKTDNQQIFYNIDVADDAIQNKYKIAFDYNRYGIDKKLHKASNHTASPYLLILHNQHYYLMAFNDGRNCIAFYRLDRITDIRALKNEKARDIHTVPGYSGGIDYKELATARPYMFSDPPKTVEFVAEDWLIDQIVDWFGYDFSVTEAGAGKIRVLVRVSPAAMEYWAMQYANYVEVIRPSDLRAKIAASLSAALLKYAPERKDD